MQNAIRHHIKITVLAASLAAIVGPGTALAQSGSAGGSIDNDEKSLSGSRSAEPERPTPRPRRSGSRRSGGGGGGGGGNFDGAWVGTPCGSATTAIVVTSGKIIGDGLRGAVSPSGAASSVGNYGSLTVISSGRFSGHSGAGTFKRSDGCVGSWTVSKQ